MDQQETNEDAMSEYADHLDKPLRVVNEYFVSTGYSIGDILQVAGIESNSEKERAALKRIIDRAVPEPTGNRSRRFTGHELLLFAVAYNLYENGVSIKHAARAYELFSLSVMTPPVSPQAAFQMLTARSTPTDHAALLTFNAAFPLSYAWISPYPFLIGRLMNTEFSMWTVEEQGLLNFIGSKEQGSQQSFCPTLVVDLVDVLRPIVARVDEPLPDIGAIKRKAILLSIPVDQESDDAWVLSPEEKDVIERIRHEPEAYKFEVATNGHGSIKSLKYSKIHHGKRATPNTLLSNPHTKSVTSYKSEDGTIGSYGAEIQLKFS